MTFDSVIKRSTATFLFLALIFPQMACQQGRSSAVDGDDTFFKKNPFSLGSYDDLDSGLNSGGTLGGSGGGGGLSDADKKALQNVFAESEEMNPEEDTFALSQELQAYAEELLQREKQGQNVQQQKMMLAAKMLQECANKVADLAPVPGEPLLGKWNGAGACAVNFEVTATGQGGLYKVSGGTTGQMQVDAQGNGEIAAKPFKGTVTDQPNAGTGSLTHPTFHQDKNGTKPCTVQVTLKTSRNPIPENYIEAMRRAGKCYRQTLMLMSPVMSSMFDKMDPALAQILQSRILGIGQ